MRPARLLGMAPGIGMEDLAWNDNGKGRIGGRLGARLLWGGMGRYGNRPRVCFSIYGNNS